jgi:hypothetical protein
MGIFRSIIETLMGSVLDSRHNFSLAAPQQKSSRRGLFRQRLVQRCGWFD